MQALNRTNAKVSSSRPIKIMQFGGGNFLRAFVDWMVQVLNEETSFNAAIAVIKPTERGTYEALRLQEGLFTVVLDGVSEGTVIAKKKLVDCLQEVINPYTEWEKYLELAENPDLRFVISNTTEAGIKFSTEDAIDGIPPREFPAKLTKWLHHRFKYFKGEVSRGCILLPCELIEDNGLALKKTVLKYADHWNLEEEFKDWIKIANHFCSTLVDRIVSGYPRDRSGEILKKLGYNDELLVAGEYYHSWVIEAGQDVQNELPFGATKLNVEFVEDLAPYREMKVRILNGAHTSMVPVAYLAGLRYVDEAMEDSLICDFVKSLLLDEAATTLDFSEGVKKKFVADVLDRFRNPLLKHQLISISLNSTSKFVARLLPTLEDYYRSKERIPDRIVFGLSALILFYKGAFNGEPIALKDDQKTLDFFSSAYHKLEIKALSAEDFIKYILGNQEIWGKDLTKINGLVPGVLKNITQIQGDGVRLALKTLN